MNNRVRAGTCYSYVSQEQSEQVKQLRQLQNEFMELHGSPDEFECLARPPFLWAFGLVVGLAFLVFLYRVI